MRQGNRQRLRTCIWHRLQVGHAAEPTWAAAISRATLTVEPCISIVVQSASDEVATSQATEEDGNSFPLPYRRTGIIEAVDDGFIQLPSCLLPVLRQRLQGREAFSALVRLAPSRISALGHIS